MKRSVFGLLAIAFGAGLAVTPALAHHSFAAEYDNKKPVTLKGIITKVDWTNPHVYFFIDVKTDDQRFHAYESKTGKLLWETKLPAKAFANPITYLGRDGKQYVVVAAQETMIAFRLP